MGSSLDRVMKTTSVGETTESFYLDLEEQERPPFSTGRSWDKR